MQIQVNGENFEISLQATLGQLIALLELKNSRYAIEVNDDIVPRGEHASYLLTAGDRVEVVQAIGGG